MNCRKQKRTQEFKLTYFKIKGRSYLMRLMFAEAGVNYQYEEIDFADWPKRKPETPTGFLPMLTIDGKHFMGQTGAIARYLARELKLDGDTSFAKAKIDMLFESLEDAFSTIPFKEPNEETKKELMEKSFENNIIPFFQKVEKQCEGDFVTGKNITYFDIALLSYTTLMESLHPDVTKGCVKVQKIIEKVKARPKIKAWLAKQEN